MEQLLDLIPTAALAALAAAACYKLQAFVMGTLAVVVTQVKATQVDLHLDLATAAAAQAAAAPALLEVLLALTVVLAVMAVLDIPCQSQVQPWAMQVAVVAVFKSTGLLPAQLHKVAAKAGHIIVSVHRMAHPILEAVVVVAEHASLAGMEGQEL
jgi:hypothetical protein